MHKGARTDLCGGREATHVPTATAKRSLSFKRWGFSQFFLKHFLEMSVCLWTHD